MISDNFAFLGFDELTWNRLVGLLLAEREDGPSKPRGVLVVVVDGSGVPVASFHTAQGGLDPQTLPPLDDLAAFCDATAAGACVVMRERTMSVATESLGEPLGGDEDFVVRVMRFVQLLRALGGGDLLQVWPNPVPELLATAARPAGQALLPDDRAIVLAVFEDGALFTAAALRRREGEFDLLAGPKTILDWTGPIGGDWRRDQRAIRQAVERELGPIHAGLFTDLETAREVFIEGTPGAWALGFAARSLIVDPFPGVAAAALGANGLIGVAHHALRVVEEMDPDEVARIAQGFWRGLTDGKGIAGILGFSPTEAFSEAFRGTLDAVRETRRPRPSATPDPHGDADDPTSNDEGSSAPED